MKNIFKRFDFRVIVAIVATISAVVILSDFLIFRLTYQAQLEGASAQLKTIAQTTALLVDGDRLSEIPLDKEGVHTPAYNYVEDQLKKIKVANPQIKYIYILKKVDGSNVWRFVVNVDPEGIRRQHSYPGDAYDAGRFQEMIRGFDEPSADKKIQTDEWGSTLSGYAPIRNALGQPESVFGGRG